MPDEKLTILFCSRCGTVCGVPSMAHDCPERGHRRAPWRYVDYVPAKPAEARVAELEAALSRAVGVVANSRVSTIGPSRVHSPQIDVRTVAELQAALKGEQAK